MVVPLTSVLDVRTHQYISDSVSDHNEQSQQARKQTIANMAQSYGAKTINPSNVPEPQPQFSQINTFVLSGPAKIVAITGQLAIQPDGKSPTPESFDDQVKLALQNLGNCLEAAGAQKKDIFKVTHYVVDFDFEKKNPAGRFIEWLRSEHRPASVMVSFICFD